MSGVLNLRGTVAAHSFQGCPGAPHNAGASRRLGFSVSFFHEVLSVPIEDLNELRATELWAPIISDAKASLGDLRALSRYDFKLESFPEVRMPVLLQIGAKSFRDLYVTDSLFQVFRDVRIGTFEGQAHEAMTTAPKLYAEAVIDFLLA
jgi:pimeloyl-ACP methyl ester carboxylesterase